ncbi:MAG TPA: ATP-binding cassette domain-containing protein [Mycobacteriales bacterium]|jgi:branched-chain amino acid transport system ATP-binding protein|nr:ATP-binding cassette domain-containing protein [Mycobacteriales bacterium]
MSALLEIRDLTVRYGGVTAVDSASLEVAEGTVVGLIGPNGAGKTSLIDALTGFTPCTGSLTFDGAPIGALGPHERARAGLTRTFQSLELFEDLTLRENLLVAAEPQPWWGVLRDLVRPPKRGGNDRVTWALEAVGLAHAADEPPTGLSHGQRKLAAVARALAARPRLVLLDEPAAGLDSRESLELGSELRRLLDHDVTVLLVDHDMGLVLSVCDLIYVLEFGRVIAVGTPAEIRRDERVIAAYLGGSSGAEAEADPALVEGLPT